MPNRTLETLLLDLFEPDELLRLLRELEGFEPVRRSLHLNASPAELVAELVAALQRRGMLDAGFFDLLRSARPLRRPEINGIEALIGQGAPGPDTTMLAWCRRHPALLLSLLLVAVVAGTLAWALAWVFAAESRGTLGLQAGQAAFCVAVWLVFSSWTEPDPEDPVYRAFTRSRDAALAGPRGPEHGSLHAFGSPPGEEAAEWFGAARSGNHQILAIWRHLWLFWALLYAGLAVRTALVAHFDASLRELPAIVHYVGTIPTLFNNATAGALLIAFWIMTFVTVEVRQVGPPGVVPERYMLVRNAVKFVIVSLWLLHLLILGWAAHDGDPRTTLGSVDDLFRLISGVGSGLIMAMHTGRFDSRLLGIRLQVLVCLYLWAAIQPLWSILGIFAPDQSAGDRPEVLVLFAVAWLAKALFFVLSAWLFHTGRLEFFFLRLRRLQATVEADWAKLTNRPSSTAARP